MGILNITPDSFFEKSRVESLDEVLQVANDMVSQGADLLDIGGHSTRPNAERVTLEEELERVLPVILRLKQVFPTLILSIDTYRLEVAKQAIAAGASIFNDIGCGNMDVGIFEWVAENQVPYIMSHSVGSFDSVHQVPEYSSVLEEVWSDLAKKVQQLRALGHRDLILDPGFGFSKNLDHNFELMAHLSQFKLLGAPLLIGVSRKTMICKYLDIQPEEALNASTVMHTVALLSGANIIRVHDVKEAREVVQLIEKLKIHGLSSLSS